MAALTSPQSRRWRRHKGPGARIQQQQPPSLSAGRLADSRTATQPGSINFLPPYPPPHPPTPTRPSRSFLPSPPPPFISHLPLPSTLCVCVYVSPSSLLPLCRSPSPVSFSPLRHLHPLTPPPSPQTSYPPSSPVRSGPPGVSRATCRSEHSRYRRSCDVCQACHRHTHTHSHTHTRHSVPPSLPAPSVVAETVPEL